MLADPIIAAIKKTSKMIDMDSSYLKICVDYFFSLLGQASLYFYTWPNMTNRKPFPSTYVLDEWDE